MKPYFVYLFLFLLHIESSACSCNFDKYLTIEEYNNSALIFTGRAVRIDTVMRFEKEQKIYYVIDILYKGHPTSDTVIVDARISQGMCGIRVKLYEQRMIFTTYTNDFVNGKTTNERLLYTGLCHRSCITDTTDRSDLTKIILDQNYQFLKQIQQHKDFTFDQYYLSKPYIFHDIPADTLYAKGDIKNGTAVGTWNYYNADKVLCKQKTFSPEGFIMEIVNYYKNGNIYYKVVYDIYGKVESSIQYDEVGTVVKQENADPNSTGVREKVYYKPSGSLAVINY